MTTAVEIQSEIEACDVDIQRKDAEVAQAQEERALAVERQRLRRILDRKQYELATRTKKLTTLHDERNSIDNDNSGPHEFAVGVGDPRFAFQEFPPNAKWEISPRSARSHESRHVTMDCASAVRTGDMEWSIKGFSWLEEALSVEDLDYACSRSIIIDRHGFQLVYHPGKGRMGCNSQRASLAILHEDCHGSDGGVAFRWKLMVKNRNHEYVQWGDDGRELRLEGDDLYLYGPDVCAVGDIPTGVFGLTHQQLMKSEWVADDVLTVKLQIEVRTEKPPEEKCEDAGDMVEEPSSLLIHNLLALLDSGANSDVTFMVQGEAVQAHSPILSAQSKVLQTQFACGMQESTSKSVTIEDCEPLVFKAFLRYLYSDRFSALENVLQAKMDDGTASGDSSLAGSSMKGAAITPAMQQLLALAHKYDLARLQAWCERTLKSNISIDNVCPMLCQAHLYTATNLEKKCLEVIQHNMTEVIATEAFASLVQRWPQVSVKITAHLAKVPKEKTAAAVDVQEKTRKRKRED